MQNFISFVNEHLSWEEDCPHRHDCHDPPHAADVGFHDDKSPPRRLLGVARSGPWKAMPAQVGFPGDATRRRRSPWVVGSDLWCNNRGEDYLRRDRRGKDCHPEQGICRLARLGAAKIDYEAFVFAYWPKGYFVSRGPLCAGLIELIMSRLASMTYLGMSKGSANLCINQNSETPWRAECAMGQARSKLAWSLIMRARRGTRRMIVPPTPHDMGSPAPCPPRG
jgi:hypothetical protein